MRLALSIVSIEDLLFEWLGELEKGKKIFSLNGLAS